MRARRFWRNNGLSLVLFFLFVTLLFAGQGLTGYLEYNDTQRSHGGPTVGLGAYFHTAHFWEATAENWESEFLQMFAYVVLTVFLYQKGSAESKDPDAPDAEDGAAGPDAPWPVRRGGLWLKLYENSLALAFLALFAAAFAVHAIAGAREYSEDQVQHGQPPVGALEYLGESRFWFESLQNWQSEFLAVLAMVVLSIYLRQRGSPESKPVAAPHAQTKG